MEETERVLSPLFLDHLRYRLTFSFVSAASIVLIFTKFYGVFGKKLWRIVFAENVVHVYFNNELKGKFLLAELEKIHIRGWYREENKRLYRWLYLNTERHKISILIGNTALINTSGEREIEIFDEFFSAVEEYVVKRKYIKTDLKKWFNPSFVTNYYYSKN